MFDLSRTCAGNCATSVRLVAIATVPQALPHGTIANDANGRLTCINAAAAGHATADAVPIRPTAWARRDGARNACPKLATGL
ncbi:hypothetical protein K8353_00900 [Burkholderia contaminans]|nr:hypothetical protein [Burkholderia contaminans]